MKIIVSEMKFYMNIDRSSYQLFCDVVFFFFYKICNVVKIYMLDWIKWDK